MRRVLTPGLSNHTVLVEGSEQAFVVRIDGISPAVNGLNRQTEWSALQLASAAGLAPTPRYFNPDLGCLVCDYLPAKPASDGATHDSVLEVADLLRDIHALEAIHTRLDLGERLRRYEKHILHRDGKLPDVLAALSDRIGALLTAIPRPLKPVLCHNDLLAANRLHSPGGLMAIDWEYCAMGDPLFDLAAVVAGDGLNEEHSHALLEAYLQRPPSELQSRLLLAHRCIYGFLEMLWYTALDDPARRASERQSQREETLTRQLDALA